MNKLILEKAGKSFGGKHALRQVSLTLKKQEAVALLGPNGAGKSVLLKILAGIIAPDAGRALWQDEGQSAAIAQTAAARAQIGYQPEELAFWPDYTAERAIQLILQLKTGQASDAGIDSLTALCRLEKVLKKRIKDLSLGYRRRLSLALAIAGYSGFILMDEPTNGLDVNERDFFLETAKKISGQSALVYATHRLEEAEEIAGRILILKEGSLVYDGPKNKPLKELYQEFHG